MRSFDLLKKAVGCIEDNDLVKASVKLIDELDAELTLEEYEEGDKVDSASDELETELNEFFAEIDGEEDDDDEEEDFDDDEDDDDDLADFEEEDEEEVEKS